MIKKLILFTSFALSFAFANGQGSLQADYNTKFTLAEDLKNEYEDTPTKFNQLPESRFRLTNTVLPRRYVLTLTPIIDAGFEDVVGDQWTTPGTVDIDVECKVTSNIITLHSANNTIYENSTKVTSGASEMTIVNQTYDIANSFYIITLATQMVAEENYTIHIDFVSKISEELNGLYRSSYVDPETGNTTWLATSQMEALHARQVFPCFDEPAIKATFNVTIGRRDVHLALFNTEAITNTSIPGKDGWSHVKFAETVVMPTYLLAFIISTFTYTEAPNNHLTGKSVRTYAPKHYIDDHGGEYAADVADMMLAFFETYYNQSYPLNKMDSAAVPDFYFGAMENWGLNIYRETALLYFQGESNEAERFTVTRILGHELAHQWFGNLVTCNFWTHIWLNEGFATFVAALAVQHTHPEYEPWERFHNDAVSAAMLFDAQPEVTHSLKIDEEIWPTKYSMDWFDRISYEKGGSLILMMEGFLTTATLQKGLRRYLEDQKYKAAMQDDLFDNLDIDALADTRLPSGLTIKEIMHTWTLQPHFPLIRVSRAGSTRIFVSQETFTNNRGIQADSSTLNQLWWVPVSVATQDNPNFDPLPELWLDKMVAATTHPIEDTNKWVILNAGATGYYRVLYDTALTNLIRLQLEANHTAISSSTTRMHILDDYFNSAWQRYVSVETALSLTHYLANETAIVVWNAVFSNLRRTLNLRQDADFRNYLLPKVTGALTLVGGVNASVNPGMETLRHLQFLDWNCALEGDECTTFGLALYDQWKANPTVNPVRLDIRPMVYCSIVANGGQEAFDFILARYNDATISAKQKGLLLNSLGCPQEEGVRSLLDGILGDSLQIPKEQRAGLYQRLAMNVNARLEVLNHFRTNVAAIVTYFGNANAIVNGINTMSTYLGTETDFETVTLLKESNAAVFGTRLDAALRTIRLNIEWNAEFGDQIVAYMKP